MLTREQVRAFAQNAGFTGDDLAIAVAIAFSESSWRPGAVGDHGDSIGLWQIDQRWHPEFLKFKLSDPQTNALAAHMVYAKAGNSFEPWSTYRSGAYLEHM